MTRMNRPQRRYTPRRAKVAAEPSDAITREAEQLARKARTRIRGRVSAQTLAQIEEIASPVDRLEAILDAADGAARTAPAGVAEGALPCGPWWRKRLGDLRAGRTFQIRRIVTREDGAVVNLPMYPEGDPA